MACAPLKDKQVGVVSTFLEGHDAFGVLATGYRRKAFSCFPLIFEHLSGLKQSSIVIVVSPFVAIRKDQILYSELLSLVLLVLGYLVAFEQCSAVSAVLQQLSYAHPSPTHNMFLRYASVQFLGAHGSRLLLRACTYIYAMESGSQTTVDVHSCSNFLELQTQRFENQMAKVLLTFPQSCEAYSSM